MESLIRRHHALAERLAERSPRERLDALLSATDAPRAVARTNPLELYELIHQVGLRDAIDVAVLATPHQLQTFADLDCWYRDRFESTRLKPWLEVYLQLEDERFGRLYEELDPEVLPLFLQEHMTVWLPDSDGNAPEGIDDEDTRPLEPSPCNTYWLQYPEDEDTSRLCRALIDRIYAVLGVDKAWLIFEACRWELRSQMEESAYHFRAARLEDYGFRRFEEALAVYAVQDPVALRKSLASLDSTSEKIHLVALPDALMRLPRSLLEKLARVAESGGEETFLERCLASVEPGRWAIIEQQLLSLANMAASADLVEPSDREAVAEHFGRTVGTLNIGLEFIAERDLERGLRALSCLPLRQVFSAGHALLLKLQRQARELVERGHLTVTAQRASLLAADEQDLIDALLLPRPMRSLLTDEPFRTHAEVEATAQRLADIAFRELLFFGILGVSREELERIASIPQLVHGAEGMSFEKLFATLVLNSHLGRPRLQPFAPGELPRARELLESAFAGFDEVQLVPADHPGAAAIRAAAIRFAAGVARGVLDELGQDEVALEPTMIGSVLALSQDARD